MKKLVLLMVGLMVLSMTGCTGEKRTVTITHSNGTETTYVEYYDSEGNLLEKYEKVK